MGKRGDRGGDHGADRGDKFLPAAPSLCDGSRFWALATSDSDDSNEEEAAGGGSVVAAYSPTPSGKVCEVLGPGYSEEVVAGFVNEVVPPEDPAWVGVGMTDKVEVVRRVAHRRTAPMSTRPWKGPLPKVIFRATTLIRMWSLLTPTEAREHLVTGSIGWEMVARDIFNRFGWRSCNRIGV